MIARRSDAVVYIGEEGGQLDNQLKVAHQENSGLKLQVKLLEFFVCQMTENRS